MSRRFRATIMTMHPHRPGLIFNLLCGFAVLAVLVFCIPYAQGYIGGRVTLAQTLRSMWGYEEWQHCWLVIPAIGIILYAQGKELACLTIDGTAWGLIVLLGAFFFYWAGYRVENYYLGFLSIHLMIGGLILWFGGWKWLWTLTFAYGFLVFAWPLYFLENSITFPLRMIMAKASADVLNFLGIPVILQGTGVMSAPEPLVGLHAGERFRIDVADPCSGIRSLFALMMIAALYGHFRLKTWWHKSILFLSSVPLAIIGNLLRILLLTFGIMTIGPETAIGRDSLTDPSWFHMLAGYLVFAVALGGMLGIGWLLPALRDNELLLRKPHGPLESAKRSHQGVEMTTFENLPSDSRTDPY
jgi:exosortase